VGDLQNGQAGSIKIEDGFRGVFNCVLGQDGRSGVKIMFFHDLLN
jgi:hypothetical protein